MGRKVQELVNEAVSAEWEDFFTGDDEVVNYFDIEGISGVNESSGKFDVFVGGLSGPARVVVSDNDGSGGVL